jgi:hypothetical protein
MKKYIKLIATFLVMAATNEAPGQLPLGQGSIVITHSGQTWVNQHGLNNCVTNNIRDNVFVVSILNTANTSAIPTSTTPFNRWTWTPFPTTAANPKPAWFNHPTWIESNLGRIFGLTLDKCGNIFVSNTSIRNGEGAAVNVKDQILRIDGISGNITPVFNFSGSNNNLGVGNIKYFTVGTTEYMVATWWEDNSINILKNNGTCAAPAWVLHNRFVVNNTALGIPYGVAFRNIGGAMKIFFGTIKTPAAVSMIYSIQLNSSVQFTGTPLTEITINNNNPNNTSNFSWLASVCVSPAFVPVSDISFSQDFSKILVGQQSLCCTYQISAHNSAVLEFQFNGTAWPATTARLPTGNTAGSPGRSGTNAAGGVSYWNNILFTNGINPAGGPNNNALSCDTTALYTSDAIYVGPPNSVNGNAQNYNNPAGNVHVYGFQGLPSRNSFPTFDAAYAFSLKVDSDDNFNQFDKWSLGDIEAFNLPLNCNPQPICDCGKWDSIALNQSPWWSAANGPVPPSLTFNLGQVSGVLFPSYTCSPPNCAATYAYSITSATGANTILTASAGGSLNLNQPALTNLPCGSYWLNITSTCGNIKCPPIRIALVINCPPVCNCEGTVTISDLNNLQVVTQSNISNPNPVSTMTGSFNLSSSVPVTEVRMLIDELRIVPSTGNANCLLCRNKPQTWASINSASLAGVGNQTLISATITNDVREFIFGNGTNSTFSLSGNVLNFNLGVPGVTGLNCCTLKAEVCIKFIFRDVKCCEREVLKCFTFNIN